MSDNFYSIDQNLEQKQILSPQLYLQLKVLSLNTLDLFQYLKQKEDENPFISVETKSDNVNKNKIKIEYNEDEPFTNRVIKKIFEPDNIKTFFENTVIFKKSIIDYFEEYFNIFELTEEEKINALSLLFFLNSNGILTKSLEDISKEINIPVISLENGKVILQSVDKKGIGSQNLKELFLIQIYLSEFDKNYELFNFIENHWDDFINKRWKKIEKLGIKFEKINEYKKEIKNIVDLNPLNDFDLTQSQYIVPDIIIEKQVDDLKIVLNNFFNVKLDKSYKKIKLKNSEIVNKIRETEQIEIALNNRKKILQKFIQYFILYQQEFFFKGPKYIKPISQKEFAKKIGVSISTISRIISNKYIQTDYGIYPLKYFFEVVKNKKLGGEQKEYSKQKILNEIKSIIENENPKKPYSDQKISEILKSKGLNVARRTVAKYREMLGVLPSSKRVQHL